jgi:hypothetical protein
MSTLTEGSKIGDLVRHEYDPNYCRENAVLRNATGATVAAQASPLGIVVKRSGAKWVPVLATDEANAAGLLLCTDPDALPSKANNTDYSGTFVFLFRGPAKIAKAYLPTADVAGTSYTMATLVSRLEALGIQVLTEHATIEDVDL